MKRMSEARTETKLTLYMYFTNMQGILSWKKNYKMSIGSFFLLYQTREVQLLQLSLYVVSAMSDCR